MNATQQILFCDNEHGFGDVCFPNVDEMDGYQVKELFKHGKGRISALRKEAKKAGWGRVCGADYCPGCMESM